MSVQKESSAGTLRGKHLLLFMLAQLVLQTLLQILPNEKTETQCEQLEQRISDVENKVRTLPATVDRVYKIERDLQINYETETRHYREISSELQFQKETYIIPLYKSIKP